MATDEPKVTDRARCIALDITRLFAKRTRKLGTTAQLLQESLHGSLIDDVAAMIDKGMGNGS